MNLHEFLASAAAGALTYPAANFVLSQLPATYSRKARFFVIVALAFAIGCGAYGGQVYFDYVTYSPEGLFAAMAAAFTASQIVWGAVKA